LNYKGAACLDNSYLVSEVEMCH